MTYAEAIEVGDISTYLYANKVAKGALFGAKLDPKTPVTIAMETDAIRWQYEGDPTDTSLTQTCNYLLWLCRSVAQKAIVVMNGVSGGTVVNPITPTPPTVTAIPFYFVYKSDFSSATTYVNSALQNKDIAVFGNWINRYLEEDEYSLSGNTLTILISGFDKDAFDSGRIILRVDINGDASAVEDVSYVTYNLSEATEIQSLGVGTAYQKRQVIITPNGFDYTWASSFEFSEDNPEQPDAKDAGTKQIYEFTYDPIQGKDVCTGQSINITI